MPSDVALASSRRRREHLAPLPRAGGAGPSRRDGRRGRAFRASGAGRVWTWLTAGAVLLGTVLRLWTYLDRRSLWLDEAYVSDNVVNRSWPGLLRPLAHDQGAPVGWLVLQKIAVTVLGPNEFALRLVPLLSGVLLLVVLWDLARRVLPPALVPVVVLAAAISPQLVYFSSEAKQYEFEALVVLLLVDAALVLALRAPGEVSWRLAGAWGVLAVGSVLGSHLANPVVAVLGVLLVAVRLRDGDRAGVRRLVVVTGGVLLVQATLYFALLRTLSDSDYLRRYWKNGFPPDPLDPGSLAGWLGRTAVSVVRDPLGLAPVALVLALLALGVVGLVRAGRRAAALCLAPVVATLAASVVGLYPSRNRLVLALVPVLLVVLVAAGALVRGRLQAVVGVGLVVLTVTGAARTAGDVVWRPEDLRGPLEQLADRRGAGDLVLVDRGAEVQYQLYAPELGLPPAVRVLPPLRGCPTVASSLATAGSTVWYVSAHRFTARQREPDVVRARLAVRGDAIATFAGDSIRNSEITGYRLRQDLAAPVAGACLLYEPTRPFDSPP